MHGFEHADDFMLDADDGSIEPVAWFDEPDDFDLVSNVGFIGPDRGARFRKRFARLPENGEGRHNNAALGRHGDELHAFSRGMAYI